MNNGARHRYSRLGIMRRLPPLSNCLRLEPRWNTRVWESSGLKVSRIALGCMSFGDTARGSASGPSTTTAAEPIFRQAVELGITFWDTANVYGLRHLGGDRRPRASSEYTRREDDRPRHQGVPADARRPRRRGPVPQGDHGADRRLAAPPGHRLRRPLPDPPLRPETPVEETMEALHDVVKAGKARYIGASSMWAWQFAKMQHAAEPHGWTRFVSMQDQYSLMQREEEREMFGLLADQGVGSIPWSPLAKGRLARPWGEHTHAQRIRRPTPSAGRSTSTSDQAIVDAVAAGSPRPAASRWRRSRWPGCSTTRSSPRRSSGRPSRTTSPTPSRPSTSSSPTTRSASWKRPMYRGVRPGSHRIPTRAADAERP